MHKTSVAATSSDRRRIVVVAAIVGIFLGLTLAALFRTSSSSRLAAASGGGGSNRWVRPFGGAKPLSNAQVRYAHILDEFEDQVIRSEGRQAVDASTLNDLRNELRRLKKPLKILIHQLEPSITTVAPASAQQLPKQLGKAAAAEGEEEYIDSTPATPLFMHHLQYHPRANRDRTIFVAMVANADPTQSTSCTLMVDTLFEKAATPEHVVVGVVEIYEDAVNISALPPLGGCVDRKYAWCNQSTFCATDHIRVRRIHRGAVKGRQDLLALSLSMFRNERYILLTRGSLTLPLHWDTEMLMQFGHFTTTKSILTTLPKEADDDTMKIFCKLSVSGRAAAVDGAVVARRTWTLESVPVTATTTKAVPVPFVSTSYLFTSSHILSDLSLDAEFNNAPIDLYDALLSVRLFARGYAAYALPPSLQPVVVTRTPLWQDLDTADAHEQQNRADSLISTIVADPATKALVNTTQVSESNAAQSAGTKRRRHTPSGKSIRKFWDALGTDVATKVTLNDPFVVSKCPA